MESSDKLTSVKFSSNLPNELLHKVLCLLPLQTLFRLRCVCTQWRSLPFSLLFAGIAGSSSSLQTHHFWLFSFRLLARKVNEHRSSTHKATWYTYSIAYDREMMGTSGYALQLPLGRGSHHVLHKSYDVVSTSSPLVAYLETGILDIISSANGLLLLTLRMSKVHDHEENNLKLFVYNPISKDMRALPMTRWAPQQFSMIPYQDENGCSGYRVYSLGRRYRPGSTNLLYSIEVFDSAQAPSGWHFVSHVRANLSGNGDLHPGTETALMGYVNSKTIGNGLGFLYWMPSLEHKSEIGRHTELSFCHMATGFFYRLPGLPFKTTFADMWSCTSGLMLVCGVARGDDLSCTCGVEIWELLQGEEGPIEDDDCFYGVKRLPQGTCWQPFDRMANDLWDHLTCMNKR